MKPVVPLLALAVFVSACSNTPPADLAVHPAFAFRTLSEAQGLSLSESVLTPCGPAAPGGERQCSLKDTLIAGVQSQKANAVFETGGFRQLRIDWRPDAYAIVVKNLTAAYGVPCSQATRSLRTPQYAIVDNVTTVWCFDEGSLTLDKYNSDFSAVQLRYLSNRSAPIVLAVNS